MHIISRKALRQFWQKHPDSESSLSRWFKIVAHTNFDSFNDLRLTFPSVDKVDDMYIFNVGGNKYRLIVAIHFNSKKIYIRHILTHREYDKGAWKK